VQLRLLARAALLFERAWPLAWPSLAVLGVFLCLAFLDIPRMLPGVLHALLLAGFAGALVGTAVRGVRALRLPSKLDADRRLERASGLRHRPLSVLTDRPALPGAEALWRAHMQRAVAQVGRLHVGLPRPGMAARDPRAYRVALLVVLVACLGIAGDGAPNRLVRSLVPSLMLAPAATTTELQAWITPPAYTNAPPLFLHPDGGSVAVPAGAHLTISLSGGSGTPTLTLAGRALPFPALEGGGFQADQDLVDGGRLAVRRNGGELAGWDLTVTADAAPVVSWAEPPGPAPASDRGAPRIPPTRLPWQVSHAYGVVSLQAEIKLKDRPDTAPLVVSIPLPGGSLKAGKGVKSQDLTAHPWAGLPVTARLVAKDAPGLTGSSAEADFTLPERRFDNPVARRLVAVRKALTEYPDVRAPAIAELEQIALLDPVWKDDVGGFLNLRAITAELFRAHSLAKVEEAQARLWQLALHLEEGGSERTARTLAEARRQVRELIEAQKRGEKVDPAELDKRIAELEKAIQEHLDALAEQLRQDPDSQLSDPDQQQQNAEDPKKLAEELRDLEKQGKPEAAEKKLAELEKMLDQLQKAKPQHRDAKARERQQKRQRGEQQMNALQDMVKREGGLLDHAQARDAAVSPFADPARRARQGTPADKAGPQTGAAPPDSERDAQRDSDDRIQQALRRAVGELMQQYGDLMGKIPPHLGDADKAMHDASQALAEGRDAAAGAAEQKAIEALQKGGQSMSEQMEQQFGTSSDQAGDEQSDDEQSGPGVELGNQEDGPQQDGPGGQRPRNGHGGKGKGGKRSDPFGRPLKDGTDGADENADVTLPEEMEQARTRAIQDELRRREGERSRPQPELDYIDRLLKQF
jgi:hypothetical protein